MEELEHQSDLPQWSGGWDRAATLTMANKVTNLVLLNPLVPLLGGSVDPAIDGTDVMMAPR